MKQIEILLALWSNQHRASSEVKKLAQAHAKELGEKILEMQAMQRTLIDLSKIVAGTSDRTVQSWTIWRVNKLDRLLLR